jgi:hypothetical protein
MKTWLVIALGSGLLACATTKREEKAAKREEAVVIGLASLCDDINAGVQGAAREISLRTDDRELRRKMIVWQLRTMQACRRALQLPDPRWAFLDLWTLTYQTKLFVEEGAGQKLLGPLAPIAIEALEEVLGRIKASAEAVLPSNRLSQITEAARLWAERNPIEDDTISARPSPSRDTTGVFDAILGVPAGVFSFGGGVKETAQAVEDVARVANHAVGAVEALPQTVRWQSELFLFTLAEDQTVRGLVKNADDASDAVVRVANTVEKLPNRVKETIRDVEAVQPEFRKTLAEGRGVVELAQATVERAGENIDKLQETFPSVERTSANAKEAGQAWEGAFAQLNLLVHPPKDPNEPPRPPAPPFDIKEAARTAEWATKAAGEVKETVIELRRIVEGQGLDERLAQVDSTTQTALDRTVARAEDLIDRLTWRAMIVIVVFFVALLGYRFAAVLVPRREG